jgi:hypothetical protein
MPVPDPEPWWGVPLIVGGFALAGVLLANLVTLALEWLRRRREDRHRWAERRLVAACDFFAACGVFTRATNETLKGSPTSGHDLGQVAADLVYAAMPLRLLLSEQDAEQVDAVVSAAIEAQTAQELGEQQNLWPATKKYLRALQALEALIRRKSRSDLSPG